MGATGPASGWLVGSTRHSDAVWGGVTSSQIGSGPGASASGWLVGRTVRSDAVWGGITSSAVAAPGVSGTVQPWATVPIRRRQLARAVIAHAYGAGYVAVPAPRQSPYLPPRRTQVRATVAHAYGSAFVAVPAPRQQPGPAPRRKPGRAVVQFRAVRTSNGTAAVTAVLRQGDYDHKSWTKKRWILRL